MISVVIPLYNKADRIARAVESVLAQTYTDWELIVVDDGSTDAGPQWVSACADPRVRLHRQANSGVSAARNKGAELARSELVAFLDGDDYWDTKHLANMQHLIDEYPGATLYGCAYNRVDDDGHARKINISTDQPERSLLDDYFDYSLRAGPPLNSSAVVVPKTVLQSIGGFPRGITSGEDLLTWARLACVGPVAYSTAATSFYDAPRFSAEKRHMYLRRPQMPDLVEQALQSLIMTTPNRAPSLRRYLAAWLRIRAVLFLELNERVNCIQSIKNAATLSRWTLKDFVCCGLALVPSRSRTSVFSRIRQINGRLRRN